MGQLALASKFQWALPWPLGPISNKQKQIINYAKLSYKFKITYTLYYEDFFLFFFLHRLPTHVGTPNLSLQVKIQPINLTLGVDFYVYGPFLSQHKGSHTSTLGKF